MRQWSGKFPSDSPGICPAEGKERNGCAGERLFYDVRHFAGGIVFDGAHCPVRAGNAFQLACEIVGKSSFAVCPIRDVCEAVEAVVEIRDGAISRINKVRDVAVRVASLLD